MTTEAKGKNLLLLEARVKAENAAAKGANRLTPVLREYYSQFADSKITKADGELTKQISDGLPNLKGLLQDIPEVILIYRSMETKTLIRYVVKTCAQVDDISCTYAECCVDIVWLTNQFVDEFAHVEHHRDDWTVEEVQKKRGFIKELEIKLRKANRDLLPFGMLDY